MVGLARPQKTFMVPTGSSMFARKCGLVNCPLRTDLDIRNLINSNAYGESQGQENKRGKKIKKQAKMSKSTKNFINDGTGLQSQLWGRKAGGSLLNSRPSWPLRKALGQQELHSDSPQLQKNTTQYFNISSESDLIFYAAYPIKNYDNSQAW